MNEAIMTDVIPYKLTLTSDVIIATGCNNYLMFDYSVQIIGEDQGCGLSRSVQAPHLGWEGQ